MSSYILKPDKMKELIDRAVDSGVKYFVISINELDGTLYAPSKKKPFYRVPCITPDIFKTQSTGNITTVACIHFIKNPNVLSKETLSKLEEI